MEDDLDHPLLRRALQSGEKVRARADAADAVLAVTDRRVVVAAPERLALAVPIAEVRRVQFDIERTRPATMVILPEHADYEAEILTIPVEQYEAAGRAFITLGPALAEESGDPQAR
jgi:hypothetical protein